MKMTIAKASKRISKKASLNKKKSLKGGPDLVKRQSKRLQEMKQQPPLKKEPSLRTMFSGIDFYG